MTNTPKLNQIKIISSIISGILLVLVAAFAFCGKTFATNSTNPGNTANDGSNYSKVEKYKSLSSYKNIPSSAAASRKTILDTLIQQESDLKEYMDTDNSAQDKSKLFSIFLDNIAYYDDKFNKFNDTEDYDKTITSYNSLLQNKQPAKVGGVVVMFSENEDMLILNPGAPFVKMLYVGEGYFDLGADYQYLHNTYSKHLTPAWSDYLSIKTSTDDAYIKDGYVTASMTELIKWITAYEDFMEKYPKFPWYSRVDKLTERYVYDFLSHESADEQIGDGHDWKKDYETLLKSSKPQGKTYKTVKDANDLKNNSAALRDYIEQVRIKGGFEHRH